MNLSNYQIEELAIIFQGELLQKHHDSPISQLVLDSRNLRAPEGSVFFAIRGERHDGHKYLENAWKAGVRTFVVEEEVDLPQSNVIRVTDSVKALQDLAGHHRSKFDLPIIGITGSNGKTIVKEWLNVLLSSDYRIVRSPRSYNSQIGVPLSVWNIKQEHSLGIFEAGISQPNEMVALERIISPVVVIITNVLSAHSENFPSRKVHLEEKLKLAKNASHLIVNADDESLLLSARNLPHVKLFSWGESADATLRIVEKQTTGKGYLVEFEWKKERFQIFIPFDDKASLHNVCTCVATLLHFGVGPEEIQRRIDRLKPVQMRLQLLDGRKDVRIVNDAYILDIDSLEIALDFLQRYSTHDESAVVISDLYQGSGSEEQIYSKVGALLDKFGVKKVFAVGQKIGALLTCSAPVFSFETTEQLLASESFNSLQSCDVLIKGARAFQFEKLTEALKKRVHTTRLEINLGAMVNNLNVFRAVVEDGVKIMCMVKAFAYGSGAREIAQLLEFNQVDYLGVAYLDEGVQLRESGCSLPIMVMNPDVHEISRLLRYNLEPEVFSLNQLQILVQRIETLPGQNISIHLKLDTGMHRLGFVEDDLSDLIAMLKRSPLVKVASIFSHLSGSDSEVDDAFTEQQLQTFNTMSQVLKEELDIDPILHIANSAAISRFPEASLGMVRLGIGLYGLSADAQIAAKLEKVSALISTVSQVKKIRRGDSVGYNRSFVAEHDMEIATVSLGYADGLPRSLSQGRGSLIVKRKKAPIIGNVCMDMTIIDVTGLDVSDGDRVEVFGEQRSVEELARDAGTIAYEILASIPERVVRIYSQE